MSNFQSVKMCSTHLSQFIPSLRGPLSNLDLMAITFDDLKIAVDGICQNMEVHGGHHFDNNASLNSTISSSHADKLIQISPSRLRDAMMTVVKQSRESDKSNSRGDSYRSRGQNADGRRRSKSKSPDRFQQRGRSKSNDRQGGRSRSNDRQGGSSYSNKRGKARTSFCLEK